MLDGEVVRGAFIIDAHDREIIAFAAVANTGISGSHIRDIMLEAVETRFSGMRAATPVEMLSDNGSAYTARETRTLARQLGLKPCFTPVRNPQSDGISEAFVHTLKRDYIRISPLPDAPTASISLAGWVGDCTTTTRTQDSKCVRRASIAHWVQQSLKSVRRNGGQINKNRLVVVAPALKWVSSRGDHHQR